MKPLPRSIYRNESVRAINGESLEDTLLLQPNFNLATENAEVTENSIFSQSSWRSQRNFSLGALLLLSKN